MALWAMAGDDEEEGQELTVRVRDTAGECDDYTASYIAGARVTVRDSGGAIVGTDQTSGTGRMLGGGCAWDVEFDSVPRASAYTVTIELPQGQWASVAPLPQELTYSYEEMEGFGWVVDLGKNF
ncbi:hypothetical protein RDV89_00800 [Nocardioides zeae]|uniref:Uncharacterized protein n=1 Tax=Nocardioides imazamoxiresistens TaxID=3231893 RepID=A0ABU3PQU3_9ACTN|nr:hypothetical protein [Nocardioides zeae]MDT9591584.1 hypothetical protein [Nocardioides zeae]